MTEPIRVLVVDDDFMVARIHRAFVEQSAAYVVVGTVHTGRDALTAAQELAPDLVLLDLYLPDRFGLDVLADIRAAGVDCDVMVITAATEADAVRNAARLGVVDYLLKPFIAGDLVERLEQYAARRGLLPTGSVSGQGDIDELLRRRPTATPRIQLPKGLSAETADLVRSALRDAPDSLSATEAAEVCGISRVSARRYLEYFVTTGEAVVNLRYGSTGRPERRYRTS